MSPSSHTAAVQNIYEQHHSWLHGWLKGKLHNACDAADVAHDTFVRILGGRHAAQIVEPRDYLATIARGLVIDRTVGTPSNRLTSRPWPNGLKRMPSAKKIKPSSSRR